MNTRSVGASSHIYLIVSRLVNTRIRIILYLRIITPPLPPPPTQAVCVTNNYCVDGSLGFIIKYTCAAKAIFYCPSMNSHRPRSQNISKESTLNPEKDSTIKRPRSHVSLEKSSQNYKPLENWAKPNLLLDVTPQLANSFGECIWRVCHVVKPEPREILAILISQINWPRTGERAGWIAVWSSSLTGW